MMNDNEMILHAAVKSIDGNIFIGKQHADCFQKAHYLKIKMSPKAEDQGFMTSEGRYVTRSEAAKIAMEAGQIHKETQLLFSEDLWCPTYNGEYDYSELKGYYLKYDLVVKKLEAELKQQKFNNEHNLSIDQQVADELTRLRRIANCTYQHEFTFMREGYCNKCGWFQPKGE